jgi:hypothetical protein
MDDIGPRPLSRVRTLQPAGRIPFDDVTVATPPTPPDEAVDTSPGRARVPWRRITSRSRDGGAPVGIAREILRGTDPWPLPAITTTRLAPAWSPPHPALAGRSLMDTGAVAVTDSLTATGRLPVGDSA